MLKQLIHSICLVLCSTNAWAEANTNQLSLRVDAVQAFEFIWIKPGQFVMGAPDSDKLAEPDEKPQRLVRIEHGFYLGRTTVTLGQFRQFVQETGYKTDAETDQRPHYRGAHGYNATRHRFEGYFPQYTWRNPGWPMTDAFPVCNVSWNDAVAFCKWLGTKATMKARLPTEAEWEYACRAGSETAYSFGEPADLLAKYAWYTVNSPHHSQSVGTLRPNEYGVFDMHGNAWEWTQSVYREVGKTEGGMIRDDKEESEDINNQESRVLRGGSFVVPASIVRSSFRHSNVPANRLSNNSFRPARTFTP